MNTSANTLKRLFSALVAALMIFGLCPIGHIAGSIRSAHAEAPSHSVTNGYYHNGVWTEGGDGTITHNINGTEVALSKTAEPVPGQENTYMITLQVETSTSTSQVVSHAKGAVVLVIDCSNSMDYCAYCGEDQFHSFNCRYFGFISAEQTRIYAARAAARTFLSQYAGTDASATRLLSIVVFNTNHSVKLGWTNVAGGAGTTGYNSALSVINGLATPYYNEDGGTNLEGGLYEANQLVRSNAVSSVTTKNVILLTDGAPTMCMTSGDGSDTAKLYNDKAEAMATNIKNANTTLYTVCFGASNDPTYQGGPRVGAFLRDHIASPGCAYDADDADDLSIAFNDITEEITTGATGEGWTVTDPMGEAIDFAGGPAYFNPVTGETYNWVLSDAQTSQDGNVTTYIYTCTYYVTIDPQTPGFAEGQYYPVNGHTYLTVDGETYDFPVPGVTGHLPRTSVTAKKVWNDAGNQDGIRPSSVQLRLKKDGVPYGDPVTLNAGNNWTCTWNDLIAKANGVNVVYTVEEVNVPTGYTVSYSTQNGIIIVTNTHVTEKTSITVTKVWNDNNNQDGIRPSSITAALKIGNTQIATGTLTAANGWQYTFENLDKYSNGQLINYTVNEINVPAGYTASVDGLVITNTHVVTKTSVEVTKVWDDDNNRDGIRPNHVIVNLLADGMFTGRTLTLNTGNGWSGVFDNLDKFHNGAEINYTVTEQSVEGYTASITGSQQNGYVITNRHVPAVISISGSKTWVDNNNQDGSRPASITVNLIKDGEIIDTRVVTAANGWQYSFTNLPKFENGVIINYSIVENAVEDYSTTYNGYNIINTHTPAKTSVTVTKTWNDNLNQDGMRPAAITVKLYANGVDTGKTLVLNAGNNWTDSFVNLDKFSGGVAIAYTVGEVEIPGYTSAITGDQQNGYVITNTHVPQSISVNGHKIWIDNNDQDGSRPASITINLLKNGQVIDTMVVTAADNWSWSFVGLPKYENGQLINYTISEAAVDGYTTTYSGFNVTNAHTPAKTSVTVTKAWEDSNDQDGIRPNSVTVALLANGVPTGRVITLSGANNWVGTFTDLDKYYAGNEIVYTIAEINVPGYETVITGSQQNGFVITNSHTPAVIDISGNKEWVDNNDQDGIRPDSITVQLLADGTVADTVVVTAEDGWAWCFEGCPKYSQHGNLINYTVIEEHVEGYMTSYHNGVIRNTHSPEQTSVTVTKVWDDAGDQDGIRPGFVTVHLLANGEDTGLSAVLTGANQWTFTFDNLDKYANGVLIDYTVTEDPVPGYRTTVSPARYDGFIITNTHIPEVVEIAGSKIWEDNNNQDGVRPESIIINLLKNGAVIDTVVVTAEDGWAWSFTDLPKYENHGTLIGYTVTEGAVEGYVTAYEGGNVINVHAPEKTAVTVIKAWDDSFDQDGIRPNSITVSLLADGEDTGMTLVLNEGNDWMGSFTDLDKYAAGEEIVYTVSEVSVPGYDTVISGNQYDGYTIANVHTPDTVAVNGAKTWNDNDDQDGMRPESITVNLLKNGEVIETVTVTAEDGWAWSFTDLPKYENHGTLITYSVTEEAVEGYTTTYNNYNVVNLHAPEKTSVTVTKSWDDAGNQDGIRPYTVVVALLANGEQTGMTLTLGSGNNWTGSFTDLDKYAAGQLIEYTVAEVEVEGYETVITGSQNEGYIITNVHTPELINIEGVKTWADNDDQDGMRPESITINLLKNGEVIETITVTEDDGWAWAFTNLPKYEAEGVSINYTVTENAVEDYSTEIDGYNITNTHTPAKTSVTVVKSWQDNNDQDGIRPESVTVELIANGEPTDMTLELNAENNWTGVFTELDKFFAGEEIDYTVAEIEVQGYETVITGNMTEGYVITNSHSPETIDVEGAKTWNDNDDQDGMRPESITINLLADGDVIETAEVTEEDGWAWAFTDLPKYRDDGIEIVYSIVENAVECYSTEYDGYNVINSYTPEELSITVTKAWEGDNTKPKNSGHRVPVTILLYADGELLDVTLVLSEDNNWTGSFTGLPKYKDGQEIVYTIDELMEGSLAEYYTVIINGNVEEGFVVTNTHVPVTGDERTIPTQLIGIMITSLAVAIVGLSVLVGCILLRKRETER